MSTIFSARQARFAGSLRPKRPKFAKILHRKIKSKYFINAPTVLLLSGGASKRFGSDKMQHKSPRNVARYAAMARRMSAFAKVYECAKFKRIFNIAFIPDEFADFSPILALASAAKFFTARAAGSECARGSVSRFDSSKKSGNKCADVDGARAGSACESEAKSAESGNRFGSGAGGARAGGSVSRFASSRESGNKCADVDGARESASSKKSKNKRGEAKIIIIAGDYFCANRKSVRKLLQISHRKRSSVIYRNHVLYGCYLIKDLNNIHKFNQNDRIFDFCKSIKSLAQIHSEAKFLRNFNRAVVLKASK